MKHMLNNLSNVLLKSDFFFVCFFFDKNHKFLGFLKISVLSVGYSAFRYDKRFCNKVILKEKKKTTKLKTFIH